MDKDIYSLKAKDALEILTFQEFCGVLKNIFRHGSMIDEDIRDRNLSIKDVAHIIGVSVSTVRRMVEDGIIPNGETSIGRGGRRLWSYRSIQHVVLEHQNKVKRR